MSTHPAAERLAALAHERPGPGRDALLRHLAGCASCRAGWLAEDPSRLFALLSVEPVSELALERLSRNVSRAVAREAPPARAIPRRYAVAAIAAALMLAALMGIEWTRRPLAPSRPAAVGGPAVGALTGPEPVPRFPQPGIQLIESPGAAQVLDLSVGDTQFVMIFDEALDI